MSKPKNQKSAQLNQTDAIIGAPKKPVSRSKHTAILPTLAEAPKERTIWGLLWAGITAPFRYAPSSFASWFLTCLAGCFAGFGLAFWVF